MSDPPDSAEPSSPEARYAARLRAGRGRRVRLTAAGVLAVCAAPLAVAWHLRPDPRGYGTHEQLGLAPCGMLMTTGWPCPTCGMTTAFAHAVRGQLIRAFLAQPSGLLLALATMAGCVLSVVSLATGRPPPVPVPALTPLRLSLGALIFFVGGWAFKIVYGLLTGELPAS